MCVVALCAEGNRLTPDMVSAMYDSNPSGAGIAWREERKVEGQPAKTVVCWEKGLDEERIQELAASVPLPYLAHFRIPTCGPTGSRVLCHPFPVTPNTSLALRGETTAYVLAHNGHWSNWEDKIASIAERTGQKLPPGHWSDTRGMAWAAGVMGLGYLDFKIREKCIAFGPKDFFIIGNGWTLTTEKIYVSNLGWRHGMQSRSWKQTKDDSTIKVEKEDHSRTPNRLPSNAGSESAVTDFRLPAHYSEQSRGADRLHGPSERPRTGADLSEGSEEVPSLRSPFDKRGRVIREITPRMMQLWEQQAKVLKNKQGHPMLSKKKWKKYQAAYRQQCEERARQAAQEKIAQIQETMARATIFH